MRRNQKSQFYLCHNQNIKKQQTAINAQETLAQQLKYAFAAKELKFGN